MSIRLLHGDCLTLMKDISANSVDLIICDLPYGCLGRGPGGGPTNRENTNGVFGSNLEWDIKIDLKAFWIEAKRILRNEHSPVIHFCTTKFGFDLYNSNPDWFRYDLVWDKQRGVSFLQANKMPMRSHEMIYVFSAKGAYYNRVDISGAFYTRVGAKETRVYGTKQQAIKTEKDGRCVLSVIQNSTSSKKGAHPTEKPVALYRWLIERYCPPNGTVLDPTFGSGNSCFTAQSMGRSAIGMEKDKGFYDKALAKIQPPRNEIISD